MVYFITDTQYIKIGYTSSSLESRMRHLKTGSPKPLSVLGYITNGDENLERELHKRFSQYRLRQSGEWFEPSQDVLDYINNINDKPNSFVKVDDEGIIRCYLCVKV